MIHCVSQTLQSDDEPKYKGGILKKVWFYIIQPWKEFLRAMTPKLWVAAAAMVGLGLGIILGMGYLAEHNFDLFISIVFFGIIILTAFLCFAIAMLIHAPHKD